MQFSKMNTFCGCLKLLSNEQQTNLVVNTNPIHCRSWRFLLTKVFYDRDHVYQGCQTYDPPQGPRDDPKEHKNHITGLYLLLVIML